MQREINYRRRKGPIYAIELQAGRDGSLRGLRAVLKDLRRYGLRCTHVTEILPSPRGARRQETRQTRAPTRERSKTVDMRKYRGEHFVKVADVRDGPIQERIVAVREGKYEKPDLVFLSGNILSLNVTNNEILSRAFGDNSDNWLDREIELYLGEIDYQGKPQEAVKARPLDEKIPF